MTSEKRDAILEGTERLMLEEGYASVTYRAVAARAARDSDFRRPSPGVSTRLLR